MRTVYDVVRVGVLLGGLVLAAASASAPAQHNVQRAVAIYADYDATWRAVVDMFTDENWSIATIDKSSGVIATGWLRVPDEAADCGSAPLATNLGTQGKFNVRVSDEDDVTRLTVNVTYQQGRSFDGHARVVACTSNGRLEARIHDDVTTRVVHYHQRHQVKPASPAGVPVTSPAEVDDDEPPARVPAQDGK